MRNAARIQDCMMAADEAKAVCFGCRATVYDACTIHCMGDQQTGMKYETVTDFK